MTSFDLITVITLLIFLTIGFFKGGIGTVLSAFKWYGAGVIAVIAYPHAKVLAEPYVGDSAIGNGITIFALYIIALIALVIISMIIASALKSIIGGAVDRFIGLILGITIGFIIISSVHYITESILKDEPEWLANGKTYELTKFGSNTIGKLISSDFSSMASDFGIEIPGSSKGNETTSEAIKDAEKAAEAANGEYQDLNIEKVRSALEELKSGGLGKEEAQDRIKEMIENKEQDFRSFDTEIQPTFEALPE